MRGGAGRGGGEGGVVVLLKESGAHSMQQTARAAATAVGGARLSVLGVAVELEAVVEGEAVAAVAGVFGVFAEEEAWSAVRIISIRVHSLFLLAHLLALPRHLKTQRLSNERQIVCVLSAASLFSARPLVLRLVRRLLLDAHERALCEVGDPLRALHVLLVSTGTHIHAVTSPARP